MLPDTPAWPPFSARFPWIGGDLQTLRNFLVGGTPRIRAASSQRLTFAMEDGTGDRLNGVLDTPSGPAGPMEGQPVERAPLLVILHGLTGCVDSFPVRDAARCFLAAGLRVLRLNLRGAGSTRRHCTQSYHAGRGADLDRVLAQLIAGGTADRFILFGISLGGNMMLKYLGEGGRPEILAAISVSAPLDLARAAERLIQPRNRLYHNWLLKRMKHDALATPGLPADERRAVLAARTLVEYDERHVAARNGFASARDYYNRCSAGKYLAGIRVPVLLVHALNDPWIPGRSYLDIDWSACPALTPLLSPDGGHVGFRDAAGSWHLRMAERFLEEKKVIGG